MAMAENGGRPGGPQGNIGPGTVESDNAVVIFCPRRSAKGRAHGPGQFLDRRPDQCPAPRAESARAVGDVLYLTQYQQAIVEYEKRWLFLNKMGRDVELCPHASAAHGQA